MNDLFESGVGREVCAALALTLGHFLWQGAAVAVFTIAAARLLHPRRSIVRHNLYLAALTLMGLCPIVTFFAIARSPKAMQAPTVSVSPEASLPPAPRVALAMDRPANSDSPPKVASAHNSASPPAQKVINSSAADSRPSWSSNWRDYAGYIVTAYLAGVMLMILRMILGIRNAHLSRRLAIPITAPALVDQLILHAHRLGQRMIPPLAMSTQIAVPCLIGVIRPVILLPAAVVSGLSVEQVGTILAHELAHLRRHDHWISLLQRLIETALFFHPAVWAISRRLSAEREICCDELVVAQGGSRSAYAHVLLAVAEHCHPSPIPALAMAGRPSELRMRIARLLSVPCGEFVPQRGWTAIMLLPVLAIILNLLIFKGADAPAQQRTGEPVLSDAAKAALAELDAVRIDGADQWVGAIRELSSVGPDAVPALTKKLITSRRGPNVAATAITLRLINDRRAIPSLTYALRRVTPFASDYGVLVPDSELHWFLWQKQDRARYAPLRQPEPLGFGRSMREITIALERLTGHTEGIAHYSFYDDDGTYPRDDNSATSERTRLMAGVIADRWQAWWDANKQTLLKPDELAWVAANTPAEIRSEPPAGPRKLTIELREQAGDRPLAEYQFDVWIDFEHYRMKSDAAGQATIALPEKIQFVSIVVQKSGLVPAMACFNNEDTLPERLPMVIPPSGTIGGIVRDDLGNPIANAQVFVMIGQKLGPSLWARILDQPATTDAQGKWSLPDAPTDLKACLVRVSHPDLEAEPWYGSTNRPLASPTELREQRYVLVRPLAARIEGVAFDSATGQPLAGATVAAMGDQRSLRDYPDVQTDAQGRFVFTRIHPEKLDLVLTKPGYAPLARSIEPPYGNVELRTAPSSNAIQGKVVDSAGQPVASAIVAVGPWHGHRLLSWHALTDAQGNFTWADPPRDDFELRVHRSGFEITTATVAAGSLSPTFTLSASNRIEGTVTDAKTGLPIETFTLNPGSPWGPNQEPLFQRERALPGRGGKFSINFSARQAASLGPNGNRRLFRIDADGYLPFISREYTAEDGHQTINVQLEPAANIEGIVVGPDEKPLKDATVLLATRSQWASVNNGRNDGNARGENLAATTNELGRFAIRPQREEYVLAALHDTGYGEISSADFQAGKLIQVAPWGRVEVTVLRNGQPSAGANVSLSHVRFAPINPASVMHSAGGKTDAKGILILDRVAPGHYQAQTEAMMRGGGENGIFINREPGVDVVSGETAKITLVEPPAP